MNRSRLVASLASLALLAACTADPSPAQSPVAGSPGVETGTPAASAQSPDQASGPEESSAADPSPSEPVASPADPNEVPRCLAMAADLPLDRQVGQLMMMGVPTEGVGPELAEQMTGYHLGSVVLLGTSDVDVASVEKLTGKLQDISPEIPILVAVDQEGGKVQRLAGGGFTRIPPATEQGQMDASELQRAAADWGTELRGVGVHWNLAPVADVVPADRVASNEPIGRLSRHYGTTTEEVGEDVAAFVAGMREAGVATSLKHFPGLGHVTANTDFDASVDSDIKPDDPTWDAFRQGIDAGAASVMISSAVFTNLDPETEGVFSRTIITGILREEMGFNGLVIADDLGAAVAVKDVDPGERGVRFLAAGGDVIINADPQLVEPMSQAIIARAQEDPEFAQAITASAARVLTLKNDLRMLDCED